MKAFCGVVAGLLAAAGCLAQTPKAEVRRFLHGMCRGLCEGRDRFWVAFPDLNGDGRPEAIVYLMSRGWCGTGGCATRILKKERGEWKVISDIAVARPPMRVMAGSSHGWRNVGVWRAGGGIETPYEEALQFDGRLYRSVEDGPQGKREGRVVLDGRGPGLPLFAPQPSFDCTRAATPVEKQICADPGLAQLDVGMADAFRGLLNRASPEDATAIGRDQAAWFRSYAAACNAPMGERDRSQCIAQRLDARRQELERRQAADK